MIIILFISGPFVALETTLCELPGENAEKDQLERMLEFYVQMYTIQCHRKLGEGMSAQGKKARFQLRKVSALSCQ